MNLKIALLPAAALALFAAAALAQQASPAAASPNPTSPPPAADAAPPTTQPQPKKADRSAPSSAAIARAQAHAMASAQHVMASANMENLRAELDMMNVGGALHDMDMRIGPPGIWWKRPELVQKLALTPDQQKRMDDVFQKSRIDLIDLKANVEKQNVLLEPMLDANPPDTAKTLAQIDRAAQARADLEKANAHMLLGIRAILTPDQWTKLQADERSHKVPFFFSTPNIYGTKGPGVPESMMLQIPAMPSIEIPAMPSVEIPDSQIDNLLESMPPLPGQ